MASTVEAAITDRAWFRAARKAGKRQIVRRATRRAGEARTAGVDGAVRTCQRSSSSNMVSVMHIYARATPPAITASRCWIAGAVVTSGIAATRLRV